MGSDSDTTEDQEVIEVSAVKDENHLDGDNDDKDDEEEEEEEEDEVVVVDGPPDGGTSFDVTKCTAPELALYLEKNRFHVSYTNGLIDLPLYSDKNCNPNVF